MKRAAIVLTVACAAGTVGGIIIAYLALGHITIPEVPF